MDIRYHWFWQIPVRINTHFCRICIYIIYIYIYVCVCCFFINPWQPKSKSFCWQYFVLGASCRQLSCMACKGGLHRMLWMRVSVCWGNHEETMEQPFHVYWRCHVGYCEWNGVSRLKGNVLFWSFWVVGTVLPKKAIAIWVPDSETHPCYCLGRGWICKPT